MNLSRLGLRSIVIGLIVYLFPIQATYAATAEELRAALDPGALSGELVLTSGGALPAEYAESAVDVIGSGSVRLSTGLAENDVPLADTDFGASSPQPGAPPGVGDGQPDVLRFTLSYADSPSPWSALVLTTRFETNELGNSRWNNDFAELRLSWLEGGVRNAPTVISLGNVNSSYSTQNPSVTTRINVSGLAGLQLEFVVADAVDGAVDSALVISSLRFSGGDIGVSPGDGTQYPQDVNLANGTFSFSKPLISVPGVILPFNFSVLYNTGWDFETPVGAKWTHSYRWMLETAGEAVEPLIRTGSGTTSYFERIATDPPGYYRPKYGANDSSLFRNGVDGTWLYVTAGQVRYLFDGGSEPYKLLRITEPNGNSVAMSYDEKGRLSEVTDTRGQVALFTYDDESAKLVRVSYQDESGTDLQVVSFEHDGDDLIRIVDANGIATEFVYDQNHNIKRQAVAQNGLSRVLLLNDFVEEGGQYKVSRQTRYTTNGGVSETKFEYALVDMVVDGTEKEVKRTVLIDPAGQQSEFYYDADKSMMLKAVSVRDVEWTYGYDENDNQTRVVEPSKFDPRTGLMVAAPSRDMEYDERGNMIRMSDAYSDAVSMIFDARNNLVAKTDQGRNTTNYRFDGRNNNTGVLFPLGDPEAEFEYDHRGLRTRTINRRGYEASFEYDPQTGEMLRSIDPFGNATSYAYDMLGRVIAQTTPTGATTRFEYDAGGRLLTTIDPLQREVRQAYDIRGLVTERSLPAAGGQRARMQYEFDGRGLTTAEIDPLELRTAYEYDERGKMTRMTTPAGKATSYEYDDLGLLSRTIDAAFSRVTASYDEFGRRTSFSFPEGLNTVTFEYDLLDRLTSRTDSLGNMLSQSYDERGLVATIVNGRGQFVDLDYDVAGRVTAMHTPERSVVHELDDNGNIISSTGDGPNPILRDFDALDRLVARTDEWGNTVSYVYDANGNLTTLTYSDGKQVHYGYDITDRLIEVEDWDGNVTRYEYDEADNLSRVELPDGSVIEYRYDIANRMLGVSDTTALGQEVYRTDRTLNDDGLIMSESILLPLEPEFEDSVSRRQYGPMNELLSVDDALAEHDADGNLVSAMVDGKRLQLSYDSLNRLVAINQDSYRYDADGLRSEAVIDGRTVRYVNDPNATLSRVLEEHDAQGNVIARYVWGLGLISRQDGLLGMHKVYHFDTRGSTLALTDLRGHVTDRYAYAPYGKLLAKRGSTDNPFTYVGAHGVIADGNGLYFMRARYYEPNLRRFITRDELSNVSLTMPQTLNLYAYGNNDPVGQIDPEGEFGFIARAFAGAAINVGIAMIVDAASGENVWDNFKKGEYLDEAVEGLIAGAFGGLGPGSAFFGSVLGGAAGGLTEGLIAGRSGSDLLTNVGVGAAFGAAGGLVDAGLAKRGDDILEGFAKKAALRSPGRRAVASRGEGEFATSRILRATGTQRFWQYAKVRGAHYTIGFCIDVDLKGVNKLTTEYFGLDEK